MSTKRLITVLGGALALSLAVNLFVVGVMAGRLTFQTHEEEPQQGVAWSGMRARFLALPQSDRAPFRAAMLQHAAELRATTLALRSAQWRALEALRATPYDKARMQAAFAAVREATTARQAALHAALVDAIGTLRPEARAALVAASGVTQP
jgi:uncharacterized membrane protein